MAKKKLVDEKKVEAIKREVRALLILVANRNFKDPQCTRVSIGLKSRSHNWYILKQIRLGWERYCDFADRDARIAYKFKTAHGKITGLGLEGHTEEWKTPPTEDDVAWANAVLEKYNVPPEWGTYIVEGEVTGRFTNNMQVIANSEEEAKEIYKQRAFLYGGWRSTIEDNNELAEKSKELNITSVKKT
jgi:hypothetical protein